MVLTPQREAELRQFAARLKIDYVDLVLLNQAFQHSSYINEQGLPHFEGNERLEFLGDAVLGLVVTDELYRRFQEKREGELSKVKSVVVSRKVLSEKARQIDLGDYILLGRGEELTGGRARKSILANTYECLIGVLFLSGGIHFARQFILNHLEDEIEKVSKGEGVQDFKSRLQEKVQQGIGVLPRYRVADIEGPDHDKQYRVEVLIDGEVMGEGQGKNKKSAEQLAARQALEVFSTQTVVPDKAE